MTVCVAALANNAKAIVLISDKAITYGDNRFRPAVQGDSGGVEKLLAVGDSGWHALLAGNPTIAEAISRQMADDIVADPSISKSYPLPYHRTHTPIVKYRQRISAPVQLYRRNRRREGAVDYSGER